MTIEEILEITNQVENIDGDDVYILEKGMHRGVREIKAENKVEKRRLFVFKVK